MTCTATPLGALMQAGLKFATTEVGSAPRALPLWCGPERTTYFSVQN